MHIRCGRRRARRAGIGAFVLLGLGMGLGLNGCGSLEPVARYAPTTDPTQLYMSLVLNHRAITLSTVPGYDTLQLTATPLDATLAPMPGLPAPVFTSSDTTTVWVTPTGQLQARAAGSGTIRVIADLTAPGNIRHADTALVKVTTTTDPPPVLASLSLAPMPPDSAIRPLWSAYGGDDFATRIAPFKFAKWTLLATARDADGNVISGLPIEYRALDSAVAVLYISQLNASSGSAVNTFAVTAVPYSPGQVRMVARATVYGVTREDTVAYTVTWPVEQSVDVGYYQYNSNSPFSPFSFFPVALPAEVRIVPYGVVSWINNFDDSVDITFDDNDTTHVARPPVDLCDRLTRIKTFGTIYGAGDHCGTGSFVMRGLMPHDDRSSGGMQWWTVQVRQFPVPGVYTYHSLRKGFTGRVVVTTDPDLTALP